MPLLDFDQEETWKSLYAIRDDFGQLKHFDRSVRGQILGNDHWKLLHALEISNTETILLVGAGFGWVAEDWEQEGFRVIALETSQWIHQNKNIHARINIHNENVLQQASHNKIKSLLGRANSEKIDWVITEDVLPCLSDTECLNLCNSLRKLSDKVVHWVTPLLENCNQDPSLNWKTLEDWKNLIKPDLVAHRGTSFVL